MVPSESANSCCAHGHPACHRTTQQNPRCPHPTGYPRTLGIHVFCLSVTGDERGSIWLDDRANDNGVYPILDPRTGQHIDFCTWYETWLDHSMRLLEGAAMG